MGFKLNYQKIYEVDSNQRIFGSYDIFSKKCILEDRTFSVLESILGVDCRCEDDESCSNDCDEHYGSSGGCHWVCLTVCGRMDPADDCICDND